ncbi:hypothetical protein BDW62DRAFT_178797 [Aspergillus aurantiobrunneus]
MPVKDDPSLRLIPHTNPFTELSCSTSISPSTILPLLSFLHVSTRRRHHRCVVGHRARLVTQECRVMRADIDEESGQKTSTELGDQVLFCLTDVASYLKQASLLLGRRPARSLRRERRHCRHAVPPWKRLSLRWR